MFDLCDGCGSSLLCTYLYFELFCLIVGESLFPVYPAERCALNGKVTVVLNVGALLYELS